MEVDYGKVMDKVKFWKSTIEAAKDFTGTTPPSIFIGRFGYPKVYIGILSPPIHQSRTTAEILDLPERWYANQASIEKILNFRGQMIYSRFKSPVKKSTGKLVEATQEIAMVKRPVDVEVELKKKPTFKMKFDTWATPIGNPAPIVQVKLTENPSVERRIDYMVSDMDVKAEDAVFDLYKYRIPVSRIQKIFSAGLLGMRVRRKFVPTRWSITAVDDIISKNIINRVKDYQQLGELRLFNNEYLGNHYEILLIPGAYEYELVEAWDIDKPQPSMGSDYERHWMRKSFATSTHGAFYSGRLAVGEYLENIKRQATVLIVREVRSEYWAPVGIWQMRETVRGAFSKPSERFDTLSQAIDRICSRLKIGRKWIRKSKLLKELREQKKLTAFSKRPTASLPR
jgi:hypothetical protein